MFAFLYTSKNNPWGVYLRNPLIVFKPAKVGVLFPKRILDRIMNAISFANGETPRP